jgi:thioredoxin 1
MMWRIAIGVGIGLAAGGVAGYFGRCRTGACPLTGNPFTGAMFGGLIGAVIAMSLGSRFAASADMSNVPAIATVEEFDAKVLKAPTPVFVDFFATTCPPCRELEPTIAAMEAEYRGRVAFFRVDVEKSPDLVKAWSIEGTPTVIVFRGGKEAAAPLVGLQPQQGYRQALDAALAK